MRTAFCVACAACLALSCGGPKQEPDPPSPVEDPAPEPTPKEDPVPAPKPTPTPPVCPDQYKSWAAGPKLGDGCFACSLTCEHLQCRGFDDQSDYTSEHLKSIDFTWHCVEYAGRAGTYVSLTFESDGYSASTCWKLTLEFTSSGICP